MLPYQTLKLRPFCPALFEGESAVRIIFSLSRRPGPSPTTPSQAENRALGTKFEMQAEGLEEEEEMRAIRKTILTTFLLALAATTSMAQFGANDASVRDVVRRIQTRTDSLQRAVQNAADRNNYRVDDINRLILDFETALNQLDRRLGYRRTGSSDAQAVLDRAAQIDNFFAANRLGAGSRREWQAIRPDVEQLATFYSLNVPWNASSGGVFQPGDRDNNYSLNDFQMRQLIDRLNVRSATFSRNLRNDLNRGSYNDRSFDEVRQIG